MGVQHTPMGVPHAGQNNPPDYTAKVYMYLLGYKVVLPKHIRTVYIVSLKELCHGI